MIGLSFRETMSGAYRLCAPSDNRARTTSDNRGHATSDNRSRTTSDVDRPMHFTVEARLRNLRSLLTNAVLDLRGEVVAEGFADHKVLSGTLCIDPVRGKVLVYQFGFEGNDGEAYTFTGRKTLSKGNIVQAMTVLPGGIFDASGDKVATALLRFDLRSDLIKFLRSYRLVAG